MKIALIGYGKMGKAIEKVALERGHTISFKSSKGITNSIKNADVSIEFSTPKAAAKNISYCLNNNIPIISGTTGWLDKFNDIVNLCNQNQGAFIYASNFSLGVNLFFEVNKHLAKLMAPLKNYNASIEEIHHAQKLDAPSGTAITLANQILKEHPNYTNWSLNKDENLHINAKRIANVSGTHTIYYKSNIDTISITHEAHSRKGFALGAVVAAEWLQGKTGIFTMKDVLNIG